VRLGTLEEEATMDEVKAGRLCSVRGAARFRHGLWVLTLVCAAALPLDAARAGTYGVVACDAAPGAVNGAWRARDDRGMEATTSCPSRGKLGRGLVVRNRTNAGRVRRGDRASMRFEAPEDATLRRIDFDWDGDRVSGDWAIGLRTGDGRLVAGCRSRPGRRASCRLGDPKGARPESRALGGRSVRLEAECEAPGGCSTARSGRAAIGGARARVALHSATVTVDDPTAPAISALDGDLLSPGWQRGPRSGEFRAIDNSGVGYAWLDVDGRPRGHDVSTCDFTKRAPCPGTATKRYVVDTRTLADGEHSLSVTAVDAAGNHRVLGRPLRVDNHAPGPVRDLRVLGGEGVRAVNSFDVRWVPPPRQAAPIAAARYRLCPVGSGECVVGSRAGAVHGLDDLSVPGRGEWRLEVWLEDAAGNRDFRTGPRAVRLRFDDRVPTRIRAGLLPGDGKGRPSDRLTVDFGRSAIATGTFSDAGGALLGGRTVSVFAKVSGRDRYERIGSATTDHGGRFRRRIPPGPSRTIRLEYAGGDRHRPAATGAKIATRAKSTIEVDRHRVRNGDRVTFRGRLLGRPVPREGKLLQLEAHYRGRSQRAERTLAQGIPLRGHPRDRDLPVQGTGSSRAQLSVRHRSFPSGAVRVGG
jgi:hypothetical protein